MRWRFVCSKQSGIGDVDFVVFYEKPSIKFDRVLGTLAKSYPDSQSLFKKVMGNWGKEKFWVSETIQSRLKIPRKKILFSEHHLSHVAHAYYLSPFQEAATLTIDGVGEWITTSIGSASGVVLERHSATIFPHSIGLLYSAFTEFLGFEVNEGEYKVMGMAPYGSPRYLDRLEKHFLSITDTSFELDMDFFSYESSSHSNLTQKFIGLWGQPRAKEAPFFLPELADELNQDSNEYSHAVIEQSRYYADVAASVQRFVEDLVLRFARRLRESTGSDNLCFAGGVANNSVANGRLIRESGFKNVFVPPGPGDSGAAIGAALAAQALVAPDNPLTTLAEPFLGKAYDEDEARKTLTDAGYQFTSYDNLEAVADATAARLADGKVVGWHQGRFEFGPRALGGRSIIADPRSIKMKEIVNSRIKFRELFRPFAPACVKERVTELYDIDEEERDQMPYRFMQSTVQAREDRRQDLAAVTHTDGSARLQVVDKCSSPTFHAVINLFGERTGVYALLNTSFNRRGEPIVASPRDALTTFEWSDLDTLVVGNLLVDR